MYVSSCVDGWSKLKLWASNFKILFEVSFPPSSKSPAVPFDICSKYPVPIDSLDVIRKMQYWHLETRVFMGGCLCKE